jgi:hypothetical protein
VSAVVTGLSGSLVLQDNGGNNLAVSGNGTVSFTTKLASGATYAVTVLTQPTGLKCTVASGSGTVAKANVTVSVSCAALVNYWTWISGSNAINGQPTYGTPGVAAAGNTPGARYFASTWTDASGNLWLFGGGGYDSTGTIGKLNDLWKYSNGQWTWVSGGNTNIANNTGTFAAVVGTPSPTNAPGARTGAATWVDASNNLWMFGGLGFDDGTNTSSSTPANTIGLNDLWMFNGTEWTWMGGSSAGGASGNYGTQSVSSSTNIPGARYSPSTWFDGSGNLWLFGGSGYDSGANIGLLNDLWKFDGTNWTWVSGSETISGETASYGTLGTPSSMNMPGGRYVAASWIDISTGTLWLFGGNQLYGGGLIAPVANDLWTYNTTTGLWTWVGGSSTSNASGNYGTMGVAAASNVPGARFAANTWVDATGRFWLFGGEGFDSAGNDQYLNDLWVYTGGQWTWVGGQNTINAHGNYGTMGVANFANDPGARAGASAWVDSTGKVGLFGGFGIDANGGNSYLNDLWKFAQH